MKKIFSIFILLLIVSCSQQKIYQLITKTPKLEYQKPADFNKLNDYGKDAVYLSHVIETAYPRIFEKIPDFKQRANEFIKKSSNISNEKEFDIELKKFISLLEDGHSNYNLDFKKYDKEFFHMFLFREKNSWIIGNIDKNIDSLVIGSKILSINNYSIAQIEDSIRRFESGENDEWKFQGFASHFAFPTYWEALGFSNNYKVLNIVSENKDGTLNNFKLKANSKSNAYKVVTAQPKYRFTLKQNNGFYNYFDPEKRFAYLQMNTSLDIVSLKDGIGNYTNFITRPIAMAYLRSQNKDAKSFGLFLSEFFSKVQQDKIETVILDLSYNTGGDQRPGKQFVWYIARDQEIKRFQESIQNSEYLKKQIKNDWKEYNDLYIKKYSKEMPYKEINLTTEFHNEPYFDDITKKDSPFYLNKEIPKFDGKVYVITSPTTFSAAQMLATTISDNHLAKIIGRPSGNKPTSQTGASGFKLPNTKKIISLSYLFMERPDTSKNTDITLYPNVEIYKTFDELMKGENKIIDYIIDDTNK